MNYRKKKNIFYTRTRTSKCTVSRVLHSDNDNKISYQNITLSL